MIRANMKNWFMLVAMVFVMVADGAVCGISAALAAAKPIKLRMMIPREPWGASPLGNFQAGNSMGETVAVNVLEPLIDYTKDGPVPKLATKWEHSADLTKWRLYLRKGVKFQNGADFTARDVVEFAKWFIEIKGETTSYQYVPLNEAVAVDNYTVDLIFKTPQPLFLIMARTFLIPPVAISRDNREMYKTNPIGTGPYRFVEWKRGQYIKLAKFEGYWGPKPQIDDVEIIFREEEQVRLAALLAGEVDWVHGLGPESASSAPRSARMPSPETAWLRFDESIQKNPVFADKRLRLAVEYAIERKALVDLYGGYATPSLGQFASPGDFGFNPNLKSRPYDLEKARALVKEAGAVGKTLTLVGSTEKWTKAREVAEAIVYMIGQTGLKVKPMLMPHVEMLKYKRLDDKDRYMSDIVLSTSDSFLEVESRYLPIFTEHGRQCTLNDLEPGRLHKEAVAETNFAKRGEKVAKAWAYVYEEAHYVPILKLESIWGIAKNLEWKVDIAGRPFFADMRFTN